MSITDKERHVLNVGHLMRKLAVQLQYPTEMTNEMYILGCCHETPASEFEKYRYLPEIINCKNPNSDYESPALTLLNFAEIHIDERGYLTSAKEANDFLQQKSDTLFQNKKMGCNLGHFVLS